MTKFSGGFILFLLFAATVLAQVAGPALKGEMRAQKVLFVEEIVDGEKVVKEKFAPAEKAFPEDVIEYTLVYWNEGETAANDVSIVGPIPDQTVYIDSTATEMANVELKYSIDKGKTYQVPPIAYTVMEEDENGNLVEKKKIATPDMYTHIQWTLFEPLEPAAEIVFKYRVKVK
ncbi:MAG: hypothetical protein D6675_04065 [Gemmatimonadetes bacterium]|nr:MAG: hypothetical protein D6675_04065 [Gemmatimonadota bacterium]